MLLTVIMFATQTGTSFRVSCLLYDQTGQCFVSPALYSVQYLMFDAEYLFLLVGFTKKKD